MLALWIGAAAPADTATLDDVHRLAGIDPAKARTQLRALREQAVAARDLKRRLEADETECRLLADLDVAAAHEVAAAGLAAAGSASAGAALPAWMRLRACAAGVLLDRGEVAAGEAELDRIIAETGSDALRAAHALALIYRGGQRSRGGHFSEGQQQLLEACALLSAPELSWDREFCLGHLANHYRRTGDFDEALALLTRLRAAARARGAVFDESIYAFSIGQQHSGRDEHDLAIAAFTDAARLSERSGDRLGIAYAENQIAATLLDTGRAAEAREHSERALSLIRPGDDPRQELFIAVANAHILAKLGQAREAERRLLAVEERVRGQQEDLLLLGWLAARAEALSHLERWREAFATLDDWRRIEKRVEVERRSEQSARLRQQFARARDAEDLSALRRLNEQGQRLRQTQGLAIVLAIALLLATSAYALRKFRQARQMHALASTDELTGLPNRRAVMAYATQRLERADAEGGGSLSMLVVDIDHFKRINDAHGHSTGDGVLRHVAGLLPAGLRSGDLVGRVGGEEFVVVLPEATGEIAYRIAERMRESVAGTPAAAGSAPVAVTASIGVAQRALGESVEALIRRADRALYAAKAAGRNTVILEPATGSPTA